jgi:four helix bundle protein
VQNFRELQVWQRAHRARLLVYRLTSAFPRAEMFGLTSQIRRSAASVGANIAEGCGRGSDADMRRCLQIALGSACETLDHAILARDLEFLDDDGFARLDAEIEHVRRMLIRLIERLGASGRRRGGSS